MLPKGSSKFENSRFMIGVRERKYWCPNCKTGATLMMCADVPPRKDLAKMTAQTMLVEGRAIGETDPQTGMGIRRTAHLLLKAKQPPNARWMLVVLATLNPMHPVFNKDYVFERKKAKAEAAEQRLDNSDGFFTGLPLVDLRGTRRFFDMTSKEAKLGATLHRAQARLTKLTTTIRHM